MILVCFFFIISNHRTKCLNGFEIVSIYQSNLKKSNFKSRKCLLWSHWVPYSSSIEKEKKMIKKKKRSKINSSKSKKLVIGTNRQTLYWSYWSICVCNYQIFNFRSPATKELLYELGFVNSVGINLKMIWVLSKKFALFKLIPEQKMCMYFLRNFLNLIFKFRTFFSNSQNLLKNAIFQTTFFSKKKHHLKKVLKRLKSLCWVLSSMFLQMIMSFKICNNF